MPKGFFSQSLLLSSKQPISRVPKCGACGLFKTCQSPKMPVSGEGKRQILVVAEAPGKEEDKQGIQLVGNSGQYLIKKLRKFGVDMRRDCWLTNAVICRPPDNADPTLDQIRWCHPNLLNTLEQLKPKVIIALGKFGIKSALVGLWKDKIDAAAPWVGWRIPSQKLNSWICPVWHPAYILRMKNQELEIHDRLFEEYIEAAVELEEHPWKKIPDYAAKVERIIDPVKAAEAIRWFIKVRKTCSFDYETNMLKPDSSSATLVSVSIANRDRVIAYPFLKEAKQATKDFLESDVPKVGANIKFEERWTMKEFGIKVNGWLCDTVILAHVLDNRRGITSVKFQGFVRFGIETYNDHISPLLEAKKGQKINQIIKEIDLNQLLIYNGLDSLIELKIANQQMEELGYGKVV
jgi:uracil-DNA glycosylase family 4